MTSIRALQQLPSSSLKRIRDDAEDRISLSIILDAETDDTMNDRRTRDKIYRILNDRKRAKRTIIKENDIKEEAPIIKEEVIWDLPPLI